MSKVIVIGGGPSGMMAALTASKNGHEVTLVERNDELGKKLKLTGGGRCNVTNNRYIDEFFDKIVTNKKFLYSAFYSFTNEDLLNFLTESNLEYKVEEDNDYKVYTKSDKATELIHTFKELLLNNNIKIMYNSKVVDLIINENNKIEGVLLENGTKVFGDKVIISTGGHSHSKTGSDGSMHKILKKYGHTIARPYPALSPLKIKEDWTRRLQGISFKKVELSCKIKKKKISKIGDLLFAHFGITGPVVLIMSSYINKILDNEEVELNLDILPDISREEISKIIRENPNKNIANNLKSILPLNYLKEILDLLSLSETKPNELTKENENKIIDYIKNIKLTTNSTLGIQVSMVTSGGVSVKEINSSTMESKVIKDLYFTGEVVDVDAETGGYNLQIAFSTGYLAGISIE
ncbi:MAG: NAD(P)/FAD-dependent oxidoreductase [Terrisporobacter othiniensis]|uniref:NAD(P)/FAD-dependent oxidoreductase n=1 Tax=Terrisporobacter othiniensis TaxID=1577792 RepID=UPI00290B2CE2|nr:NAD(P)/FAD-dependent oxidoreductase [Terrisporobacter othiniensis]MDU6986172.1 NAD(P)/FAD-dependent oxidoreductase [Terrisporobacter othiniensis]